MPDTKLPALTGTSSISLDDLLYLVRPSITTDHATGTSYKLDLLTLLQYTLHGLGKVSVTGATTATIGKIHVCSGTSADYTVTLPTAIGNEGKCMTFVMDNALTKLVTLDGNSTETIDGSLTRIMWAGESAVLRSDGAQWCKIAGKSIAMTCKMERTSVISGNIVSNVETLVPTDISLVDNTGAMAVTASGWIKLIRPSRWAISGSITMCATDGVNAILSASTDTRIVFYLNSTRLWNDGRYYPASSYPIMTTATVYTGALNDLIKLYAFQVSGVAMNIFAGTSQLHTISATELPTW